MDDTFSWVLMSSITVTLIAIDIFTLREKQEFSFKKAVLWSIIWISTAIIFGVFIFLYISTEAGISYASAYLIEKALSVDNLFVFLIIFKYFQIEEGMKRKILLYGILGAIVMRLIFILAGIQLLQTFHWIAILFGLFLVITGIRLFFEKHNDETLQKNKIIFLLKSHLRIIDTPDSKNKFVIRHDAKYYVTPAFVALIAIEITDVIFAVDSVPAVLAITQDLFIAFSSNLFAILGLRALFFVLSNLLDKLQFIHYGLALVLVLIGIKMILGFYITIPTYWTLIMIIAILTGCILYSIWYKKTIS